MAKQKGTISIDGRGYTRDVEADLNSKAFALFGSGIGKAFLAYLEGLTTQNIHPPGTNIEVLAHAEGSRYIVAIMKARCELGRKQGE